MVLDIISVLSRAAEECPSPITSFVLRCTDRIQGLDFIPSQTFLFFRFRQGPEDPHADREAGVAQDIQEQHLPIRHTVSEQNMYRDQLKSHFQRKTEKSLYRLHSDKSQKNVIVGPYDSP